MDRQKLADAIREQAHWCERLGSPLYHALLTRIAGDVDCSGLCWKALEPHVEDAARSLLPLRFLAAVHRLVLECRLPDLAKYYPSAGGTADPVAAWNALLDGLKDHADEIRGRIPRKVQTNEVTRCCALLPGFIEVARATGLPLRLLEIGCSAGLNLHWDHYRYRDGQSSWGPANSPVVFDNVFAGDASVDVVERRGCDLNPLDPTTDDGRLTLLSFVWPDQTDRLRQLSNAIEVARSVPAQLDRADAIEWLERELKEPRPGVATVVFHSIVFLYMSNDGRERIRRLLAQAGERASTEAPLAWLSMESGEAEADVHLTMWPGGERWLIARSGYHGLGVQIEPHNGEQAGRTIL